MYLLSNPSLSHSNVSFSKSALTAPYNSVCSYVYDPVSGIQEHDTLTSTHTHKIGKKVAYLFLFDAGEIFEKELDNAESVQLV